MVSLHTVFTCKVAVSHGFVGTMALGTDMAVYYHILLSSVGRANTPFLCTISRCAKSGLREDCDENSATVRGPELTITHLPVRVDDAAGLFRGQRLIWILLALAHVVLESKAVERRRQVGWRCERKSLGAASEISGLLNNWGKKGHD
jgi:hypothetical protein